MNDMKAETAAKINMLTAESKYIDAKMKILLNKH